MKSLYRKIGIFCIGVYIFIIAYIGYILLNEIDRIYLLNAQFPTISYLVITLVILGLLAFFFLFVSHEERIDVVYLKGATNSETESRSKTDANVDEETLQEGLASFVSRDIIEDIILKNQFNKKQLLEKLLQSISDQVNASVGAIYLTRLVEDAKMLEMVVSYAYFDAGQDNHMYEFGQGLVGQVAKNGRPIRLNSVPEAYIKVVSGLGQASPSHLLIFPVKNEEEEVLGIIELASFREFSEEDNTFLKEVALLLAKEIETNEYYNLSL